MNTTTPVDRDTTRTDLIAVITFLVIFAILCFLAGMITLSAVQDAAQSSNMEITVPYLPHFPNPKG